MTRRLAAALAMIAGLLALSAPALAQGPRGDEGGEPFVVLTGRLVVGADEIVDEAVIFNGDAVIDGKVSGNLVAFNGDVRVSGRVGDDIVVLNGQATLTDGSSVGGDVISRRTPDIAPGATVGGEVRDTQPFDFNRPTFAFVGRVLIWVATSVSSFLLGLALILFTPRAADALARAATERLGASLGFGVLAFFGLPLVALVAAVTLIGLPLGLGVMLALGFIYWLGYTCAAFALGRRLLSPPRHRLLAFLAGWAILRALALIPVVGGIVWTLATVWGLGALAIGARTAGRVPKPVSGSPTIPPPPPAPILEGDER